MRTDALSPKYFTNISSVQALVIVDICWPLLFSFLTNCANLYWLEEECESAGSSISLTVFKGLCQAPCPSPQVDSARVQCISRSLTWYRESLLLNSEVGPL